MTNDRTRTNRVLDLTIDIDATLEEVWHDWRGHHPVVRTIRGSDAG